MQSFLGEAGKGGNALKQVAQREGVDNSLFRDRFAPQAGSSSSQQPFRQGFRPGAPPTANGGQSTAHPPQPFNSSHLSAALADPSVSGPVVRSPAHHAPQHFEQSWAASGPASHQPQPHHSARSSPGPGFAAEFTARPPQQHAPQSGWAESFQSGKGKGRALEPMQPGPEQHHIPSQYANQGYGGYQPMMPYQPSFTPMYSQFQGVQQPAMQPPPQMQHPGQADKGMDEAFEKAMADWKAMGDAHKESQHENGAQEQTQNTEAKEQADDGIVDKGETKGELDQIWESLRPEAERLNKLAEWENDFSQFTHDEDDSFDTLNESLNRPDVGQTPLEEQMRLEEGFSHPLAEGAPTYMGGNHSDIINDMVDTQKPRSYEYTLPNRFDSMDPQEAWTEANRSLNSGGSLTDATLSLESYSRRAADVNAGEPIAKELAAWSLLGKTHAMNEKEEKASSAFEEGRQAIKGGGAEAGMGDMSTNLAISYVNESADFEASQVLHQFSALVHPEHAGAAPQRESIESRANPWASHHEVTDKYLNLARDQYNSKQVVDPDVQVGSGTLYYMMGEYNEARDCWVAALGERPDDYLLWNRLGATSANGGNPEEAVDAYRRASELKPSFTRATFNLGVACSNIGVHKEAAEHILAALSSHSRDAEKEQRDSTPMWSTLRRASIALDMLELSGKARPGADSQTFREAGFDF